MKGYKVSLVKWAVTFFAATEGSTCEESGCNESSMYESDSTFYRQSEGLWSNNYLDMYGLLLYISSDSITFIQWTFENTLIIMSLSRAQHGWYY